MATDGDIDFTTYTREQLGGAVTRLDRERYPINARRLIDEYERRRVEESGGSRTRIGERDDVSLQLARRKSARARCRHSGTIRAVCGCRRDSLTSK
jgi:hypothetical protein